MKVVYATVCSNPAWELLVSPVVQSRGRPRNAPAVLPCYGSGTAAELSSGLQELARTPISHPLLSFPRTIPTDSKGPYLLAVIHSHVHDCSSTNGGSDTPVFIVSAL